MAKDYDEIIHKPSSASVTKKGAIGTILPNSFPEQHHIFGCALRQVTGRCFAGHRKFDASVLHICLRTLRINGHITPSLWHTAFPFTAGNSPAKRLGKNTHPTLDKSITQPM